MKPAFALTVLLILLSKIGYTQTLEYSVVQIIRKMIAEKMTKDRIPGLSIAIAKDGEIVWAEGFGYANLEHKVKAKPNTAYRSASIGKPITATAIMQLVEGGKLNLVLGFLINISMITR